MATMTETEPLLHQMDPQIHPAYNSHNHEQYQPTPLELYRNAIGIGPRKPYFSSSKTTTTEGVFPRGLYKRILNDHRRLQVRYYLFDTLLTASLVTQVSCLHFWQRAEEKKLEGYAKEK